MLVYNTASTAPHERFESHWSRCHGQSIHSEKGHDAEPNDHINRAYMMKFLSILDTAVVM